MPTIAVLGTGTMGAPMVKNLVDAGQDVRAFNRTAARAEGLGATVCPDPADAVRGARFVLTMLTNADAVHAVAEPMLGAMDDGAIWIQMSTVGVEGGEALQRAADDAGVVLVDAPVSGTKAPAERGELVILASGPDDAVAACAPVFDVLGQQTVRTTSGQRLKVVINGWMLGLLETLAESVVLADRLEVDPAVFLEAIDGGPLFAPYAKLKGEMMIEGAYDPSFSLANAAKDAGLAERAASDVGLDAPLLRAVAAQLQRGVDAGRGDDDMAAAAETLRA